MIDLFFEAIWVFVICFLNGMGFLVIAGAALAVILIFILPIIVIFTIIFVKRLK